MRRHYGLELLGGLLLAAVLLGVPQVSCVGLLVIIGWLAWVIMGPALKAE